MTKLRKVRFKVAKFKGEWGWAYKTQNYIEIEERLGPYEKANALAHELYHIFEPKHEELWVDHFGNEYERIARAIKLFDEDE